MLWIQLKYTPSILVCNVQVVLLWFWRPDHKILILIATYMFNSKTPCVWTFWQISHTYERTGKVVPVKCHTYILQIGNILKTGTTELSASCPGHSTLMVSCTSTYSLGGWVGPIVSLDASEKRKFSYSARNWTIVLAYKFHSLVITPATLFELQTPDIYRHTKTIILKFDFFLVFHGVTDQATWLP